MKIRRSYVIAGLTLSLLCLSVIAGTTSATEVWVEDFESGMTEWTTFAFESWTIGPIVAGNFSDAGGRLTALDNDVNFARHNSTQEVGTWKFDIYVPDVPNGYVGVAFMSNGTRPLEFATKMVAIEATTDGADRFIFWLIRGANNVVGVTCYTPAGSIVGWHHIEVTRTSGGSFNMYFNGSLEYTTMTNDVVHSTYLECYTQNATGGAFDNIILYSEILPPTTTPTTTSGNPLPWELIAIGGGVVVIVVVLVVILFRRR